MAERVPKALGEIRKVSRRKSIGRMARREESRVILELGGRTTAASGARSEKGDGRVRGHRGNVFVEHKTTEGKSNPITLRVIEKAFEEARGEDVGSVIFTVTFSSAHRDVPHVFVMLPIEDYKALVRDAGAGREEVEDECG